jgi:hypothetical protein
MKSILLLEDFFQLRMGLDQLEQLAILILVSDRKFNKDAPFMEETKV